MHLPPSPAPFREGDRFYGEVRPYPRIRKGAGFERVGCLIGKQKMDKWCVHEGGSRMGDFVQHLVHVQRRDTT